MKFETFKAGHWQKRYQHKSFEPTLVNHNWSWESSKVNVLLEKATHALGELNAFSHSVPDIDLFIQMHIIKETQASSKIEGTQTGIDEILMAEEQIQPEKRNDWREVSNFISATNTALNELKKLPLSNRVLKDAHATLMQGVRGEHKQPGQFRDSQNWIGGKTLKNADFIPPHRDGIAELMGDLEKFWHNEKIAVPHLIRVAISHYQFETIHPFLDGNGRVGRLLIPLYLISHGVLAKPSLYMSDFFKRNQLSYYDALTRVRVRNDLIHWVCFFLGGLEQTAIKGRDIFKEILSLKTTIDKQIATFGKRTPLAHEVMNVLYRKPILSAAELEKAVNRSKPTANAMIKSLVTKEILTEITGQKRNRLYAFQPYLNLFFK